MNHTTRWCRPAGEGHRYRAYWPCLKRSGRR